MIANCLSIEFSGGIVDHCLKINIKKKKKPPVQDDGPAHIKMLYHIAVRLKATKFEFDLLTIEVYRSKNFIDDV
jgi:hypothetical protein